LWAGDNFPAQESIPNCEKCGAPRIFEFQIMPHLLHHLDVDSVGQSIDWPVPGGRTARIRILDVVSQPGRVAGG